MTMGSRTTPEDGLLSLKWNNHRSTFLHILTGLRDKALHSDVTLACSGELFPVHKLVLSSCSTYFATMFASTHCQHPVIVLKDIHKDELEALLDYMYIGEVDVKQSALEPLIRAAECLHIKGLAAPDEEIPTTRAGRGSDRRSTASNSNQQHGNSVGVTTRGSKRVGTNSTPSEDEDLGEGPCSAVIKRRRRGRSSSPGADNSSSSNVTSVSVSYSSLSRGTRARGGHAESTPLQHSSSVLPNRDNARTTGLEETHSRVNQQQSSIKDGSSSHQQHNTLQTIGNVSQHDTRLRQPAASPVTSEGGASTCSQLLPSQIIKVELDDDRSVGAPATAGGVDDDEPREMQPLSTQGLDGRGGSEDDHVMYDDSLTAVKVEGEELEGRSAQLDGADELGGASSSSKAELDSHSAAAWSGDGGRDDPAQHGDDDHQATTKGTLATAKPIHHHQPGPSTSTSSPERQQRQSTSFFPATYLSSLCGESEGVSGSPGSLDGAVEASGSQDFSEDNPENVPTPDGSYNEPGSNPEPQMAELDPWQLMCFGMATGDNDSSSVHRATPSSQEQQSSYGEEQQILEFKSDFLEPGYYGGAGGADSLSFETLDDGSNGTPSANVTYNPECYMVQTPNKQGRTTVAYLCPFCKKSFADKFHWNRHLTIHTGEKPFECDICGKRYTRKDKLKAHKKAHHNSEDLVL